MQDNPYHSPEDANNGLRDFQSPRARVGDCSFVGLVLGGTVGAATGAVTAVCLLGWIALTTTRIRAAEAVDLAIVESLVAGAVVRIALGSVVGAVGGALLGALLGLLAAGGHLGVSRRLIAIAAGVSATMAALCTGLLWLASRQLSAGGEDSPWPDLLLFAIAAGALGGVVLGRKLTVHVARHHM